MQVRDAQGLFAKAGYYKGDIDGDLGPMTIGAINIIQHNGGFPWSQWSLTRRMIGAAQVVLAAMAFEPGLIDGKWGDNTREALTAFQTVELAGRPVVIDRTPLPTYAPGPSQWPFQRDMDSFYGKPGNPECTAGKVALPFAFPLAWDADEKVRVISCHRKVASSIEAIFAEAAKHYGQTMMEAYGLNIFGGCYNLRKMRGGTSWSTHAYGAAVDLDPDNNQLRWGKDRARFAQSEYDPFWKIVESKGAVSLGRAANKDFMHFQFAKL